MADSWSYNGTTALSDSFTPETTTLTYSLTVDYESGTVTGGPYGSGGSQVLSATLTPSQPAGDFFNARRTEQAATWPRSIGLFLQGTAGSQTVSFDPLAYDGTSTVSTTVHSSSASYDYAIAADDPASTITWVQGNGGNLTVSVANVGGLVAGNTFDAHLLVRVHGLGGFGAYGGNDITFVYGTSGAGTPVNSNGSGGGGGITAKGVFDHAANFSLAP